MRYHAFPLILATLLPNLLSTAQAQDDLVYVAVEPCRIVDTRKPSNLEAGPIGANTSRSFRASGSEDELFSQGGTSDCLDPKAGTGLSPAAISAYIIAVPAASSNGSSGVLTAFPSDQPAPAVGKGSTVNFSAGKVLGNTSNITLCAPDTCPEEGEFAILARSTDEHVVIDVQGYYYPAASGLAFDHSSSATLSETPLEVASMSMDIPANGYVIVNFSAWINSDAGVSSRCLLAQDGLSLGADLGAFQHLGGGSQGGIGFTIGLPVESGPVYFAVVCRRDNAGEDPEIVSPNMTAYFSQNLLLSP